MSNSKKYHILTGYKCWTVYKRYVFDYLRIRCVQLYSEHIWLNLNMSWKDISRHQSEAQIIRHIYVCLNQSLFWVLFFLLFLHIRVLKKKKNLYVVGRRNPTQEEETHCYSHATSTIACRVDSLLVVLAILHIFCNLTKKKKGERKAIIMLISHYQTKHWVQLFSWRSTILENWNHWKKNQTLLDWNSGNEVF